MNDTFELAETDSEVIEWEPPDLNEPTGWQGLVARRRRLMEQAIAFSTTSTLRESATETADFEPYVVPEGECLLPWGAEYLADERDGSLGQALASPAGMRRSDDSVINPFSPDAENEFVDELDYIRYIFSDFAQVTVLERIAGEPWTPSFVLAQLAFHPDVDVRCAVAENPRTPIEALWLLCQDEHETVRYLLSGNENIPFEVLNVMAKDDNEHIAEQAAKTLSCVRNKVIAATFGQPIRKAASS